MTADSTQLDLFGRQEERRQEEQPHRVARLSPILAEASLSLSIEGSTLGPLILLALALLDREGHLPTTGAEITRVINIYVVDDHQRKEPTNVSRALRKPVLRRQPWLSVTIVEGTGDPRYGLAVGWKDHWLDVFGMPYSTSLFESDRPPPHIPSSIRE